MECEKSNMVRRVKTKKTLKRRYFGELLSEKEIKTHAIKSNFGTQDIDEIYQKELAGHIVNSFIKWSSKLDIPQDKIQNLSIIKAQGEEYWARYYPKTETWQFRTAMGNLPIDIIDYLVLHELCHYHIHDEGEEFQALLLKHMPDHHKKLERLKEFEGLGEEWLTGK